MNVAADDRLHTEPAHDLPVGWTAPQAAALTGIPTRTVQDWRTKAVVRPSIAVALHKGGVDDLYALGDLVTLRLVRDFLDLCRAHKVSRRTADPIVARFVAELAKQKRPHAPYVDWRRLAFRGKWLLIPIDADVIAATEDDGDGGLRLLPADVVTEMVNGGALTEDVPPWLIIGEPRQLVGAAYPLSRVAAGIATRADEWLEDHDERIAWAKSRSPYM